MKILVTIIGSRGIINSNNGGANIAVRGKAANPVLAGTKNRTTGPTVYGLKRKEIIVAITKTPFEEKCFFIPL